MSETPLRDAIDQVGKRGDGLELQVHKDGDDAGVGLEGHRDFGKPGGWSGGGAVAWLKDKGLSVLGVLRWTPRP